MIKHYLKRPLPKAMRDERAKLQARHARLSWLLNWFKSLGWSGTPEETTELAELDRRLDGFERFENGGRGR